MTPFDMLNVLGYVGISVALLIVARLSQKLGAVTRARPYYVGFYMCVVLIWLGIGTRVFLSLSPLASFQEMNQNTLYVLLVDGLPALAITIALAIAWYYWSWLIAERD